DRPEVNHLSTPADASHLDNLPPAAIDDFDGGVVISHFARFIIRITETSNRAINSHADVSSPVIPNGLIPLFDLSFGATRIIQAQLDILPINVHPGPIA